MCASSSRRAPGSSRVPEDFLVGRILARNQVDADTGEIVAKANDELTEALLKKLRAAGIKDIQCLFTNELNQGAYISQTLAADETDSQLAARVAIYRMLPPASRRPKTPSKRSSIASSTTRTRTT